MTRASAPTWWAWPMLTSGSCISRPGAWRTRSTPSTTSRGPSARVTSHLPSWFTGNTNAPAPTTSRQPITSRAATRPDGPAPSSATSPAELRTAAMPNATTGVSARATATCRRSTARSAARAHGARHRPGHRCRRRSSMTRAPLSRRANTSSTSDTSPTAVMMRPGTSRPRKLVRRDAAMMTTPRASTGSPLQTRSDVSRAGRGVVGRNAPRAVASSTNENTAVTDSVNAHCPNDRRRMASADWSGTATASVNSATISSCSHSAGSARSTARPARAS